MSTNLDYNTNYSALISAIKKDDVTLLNKHHLVDCYNYGKESLLHCALRVDAKRAIVFLRTECRVTFSEYEEYHAVFNSIEKNNVSLLRALLSNGLSPNGYGGQTRSPLHEAALRGSAEMVAVLVKEFGALVETRDFYGLTPLLCTISMRPHHRHIVRQLIDYGADINFRPKRPLGIRQFLGTFTYANIGATMEIGRRGFADFAQLRDYVHFLIECGLRLDEHLCYNCFLDGMGGDDRHVVKNLFHSARQLFPDDDHEDRARRLQFNCDFLALSLACGASVCRHCGDDNDDDDDARFDEDAPAPAAVSKMRRLSEARHSCLLLSEKQKKVCRIAQMTHSYCVAPLVVVECSKDADLMAYLAAAAATRVHNRNDDEFEDEYVKDDASFQTARRHVQRERLLMIKDRATEICIALQSFRLPALVTVQILDESWAVLAQLVPFHIKWAIVTTIKHFNRL